MYRELFDISPDAMIAVDGASRIVRANAQAERLFGYREAELLGAAIEMLNNLAIEQCTAPPTGRGRSRR